MFHPEEKDFRHIALLEYTKVLLIAANINHKVYGYSLTGKTLYHIQTRVKVRGIVSFKSSDFFVTNDGQKFKELYVYNLGGMVHKIELAKKG